MKNKQNNLSDSHQTEFVNELRLIADRWKKNEIKDWGRLRTIIHNLVHGNYQSYLFDRPFGIYTTPNQMRQKHGFQPLCPKHHQEKTGQKKTHSFIEVCINTAIGYSIAVAAQILVFPIFDIHVTHSQNLQIGAIFTVISIIRSYFVRRLFNFIHFRSA